MDSTIAYMFYDNNRIIIDEFVRITETSYKFD
jgi:hypothetical protein